MRWDARLFDEPGPQPAGKRGRKPKKGKRQAKLSQRLTNPVTNWQRVKVNWYGGQKKWVWTATSCALWHRKGRDPLAIRWVIVRSVDGSFDPFALFASNQQSSAIQIVENFVRRWNIEVTFQELHAHLGFGTQRHWSDKAVQRTIPALFGLFSIIVLAAHNLHPENLPVSQSAWYKKEVATFSDALAAVRNDLWSFDKFVQLPQNGDWLLIPTQIFNCLRQITLYSS